MLGEALSKCQHLAGVPLKPKAAEELSMVYLARGVQATTAIEGNTLSQREVEQIVERTGEFEVVDKVEPLVARIVRRLNPRRADAGSI